MTGIEWDDTTMNDKFDPGESATLHIVDSAPSSRGATEVKQSRPLSQRPNGRLFITMADGQDYDIALSSGSKGDAGLLASAWRRRKPAQLRLGCDESERGPTA